MRESVVIRPTSRAYKRLEAKFENKTIPFGQKGGSAFPDHKDEKTKKNWEKRHKVREDWQDYATAGALSKHVLWNKKTIAASVADLNRKQSQYRFVLKDK